MKPKTRSFFLACGFSLFMIAIMACGASPTALPATSTFNTPPTPTSPPTQTPAPLYLSVSLVSVPDTETGQKPAYTMKAQIPALQGNNDTRVTNFNNEMAQLTQEEIAKFKDNARVAYSTPGSPGSSYDQQYKLLSAPGNLLSLKFDIYIYIDGAAHPTTHSRVVNYDLEAGANVMLEQLFLPGSNFLDLIANYCIAQLKTREIGFEAFSSGAQPLLENYGNWNITPDGLMITFDEYQVAAYAAGPQEVVVPYTELKSVIDPNGPLANSLP
jgi:hypothetical protein